MLRSQRIVLIVGLILIALLLHSNACEWRWRDYNVHNSVIVSFWTHEPSSVRGADPRLLMSGLTGLFADQGVGPLTALVVGVITPLALLMIAAIIGLGWRHHERLRRGLCPSCGYDLRGQAASASTSGSVVAGTSKERCPECGSQRA